MGIAIGHYDEASHRMRYLRDDSTDEIQWSTVDANRARVWHTAEGAQEWVYALPDDSYKRMFSQPRFFVHVAREAEGRDLSRELDALLDEMPTANAEYFGRNETRGNQR